MTAADEVAVIVSASAAAQTAFSSILRDVVVDSCASMKSFIGVC